MSANQAKVDEGQGGAAAPEAVVEPEAAAAEAVVEEAAAAEQAAPADEKLKVRSDVLVAKVKDLLHEGTVRRITVRDERGHTIMEIPVTAGVVVAVVAPVLTAVAALAALASKWEIEIRRSPEDPGSR